MIDAREGHRAVRFLHNNVERVLITGGLNAAGSTFAAAEIYDVSTGTFSSIGNMLLGRQFHTATLLASNRILITSGYTSGSGPSAEIYDPATGAFTPTASGMIVGSRGRGTATLLNDGRVLVAGGQSGDVRAEAEIYDPANNTTSFTSAGSMLSRRYNQAATLLNDGSVLISGGFAEQSNSSYTLGLASMERYVPGTGFVSAGTLEARHAQHESVRLQDGRVLIIGGFGQSYMSNNTADIYDPAAAPIFAPTTLADGSPGVNYSVTFTGSGGSGGPYTFAQVSGVLPAGMTFNAGTATLSGPPAAAGIYRFALQVTDGSGHVNVQSLTLRVGTVLTITNAYQLTAAAQNAPYGVQMTASGATGTVVWSLLPGGSPLPAGLTLSSTGLISGIPTTTNFFSFGVRAMDNNGAGPEVIKMHAISVVPPQTFPAAVLPMAVSDGVVHVLLQHERRHRHQDVRYFGGTLPAGLSLQTNGCLTNPPTVTGSSAITVRVTDQASVPQVATRDFTIRCRRRSRKASRRARRRLRSADPADGGWPRRSRSAPTAR